MRHLTLAGAISLLIFLGCTGGRDRDDTGDTDTDTDTDVLDTGRELYGIRGSAVVDTSGDTYSGSTFVYDEVLINSAGAYDEGDELCTMEFTAVQDSPAIPTLACTGCTFGYNVSHTAGPTESGAWCEIFWPSGDAARTPSFWDMGVGYHPSYYDGGPAVMLYFEAYTSGGTYHPAEWIGYPNSNDPVGGATFDSGTGDFVWDWPISVFDYNPDDL